MVMQIDVKENKHIFISSHKLKLLLINENSKRMGQGGRTGIRSCNVVFHFSFPFCVFFLFSLFRVVSSLVLFSSSVLLSVVSSFLSSCVYSSLTAWSRDADQRDKSRSRPVHNEYPRVSMHVCVYVHRMKKKKETLSNYVYSTCATEVGAAATPTLAMYIVLNGPNLLSPLFFPSSSPSSQVHLH